MAEWLVEEGIGEHRALRIEHGDAVAARLDWLETARPGLIADAVLASRTAGSRRGTARLADGTEVLIDGLPREGSEGAALRIEITRGSVAEASRFKRAHGKPTAAAPRPAPSLAQRLGARTVRAFPSGLWEEVFAESWSGGLEFPGGTLTVSPTPGMTVIDVDGTLPPSALALAAVPALASTVRRMDLGGSLGIDFPTLADKADRRRTDAALGDALGDWPHERTAMNGFGFVQLVARLEGPSLPARIAADRPGAAARLLLRRAELVSEPGSVLLLTAHPGALAAVRPPWLTELERRCGRTIRIEPNTALALDGGFAQALAA